VVRHLLYEFRSQVDVTDGYGVKRGTCEQVTGQFHVTDHTHLGVIGDGRYIAGSAKYLIVLSAVWRPPNHVIKGLQSEPVPI